MIMDDDSECSKCDSSYGVISSLENTLNKMIQTSLPYYYYALFYLFHLSAFSVCICTSHRSALNFFNICIFKLKLSIDFDTAKLNFFEASCIIRYVLYLRRRRWRWWERKIEHGGWRWW